MKQPKQNAKNNGLLSVSELAELYHHDRATINRRLVGVPFVVGPKSAELYDKEVAAAAIESRDHDMATLVHERARRAEIEREIKQLTLDALHKRMVPAAETLNVLADLAAALRNEIDSWPCTAAVKQRCFLSMEAASIEAFKLVGSDTRMREQDLASRRKQLEADIKAGRIPDRWEDAVLPENYRRVWSNDLRRYFTKAEIIKRWGPTVQFSPIDEILDEIAEEEAAV